MTPTHNIDTYILVDNKPVRCYNDNEVAEFFESDKKNLFTDHIETFTVSTIFLVFDHSILSEVPVLFETMVFEDGKDYNYTTRYSTYEDARIGHYSTIVGLLTQRRENA